jgi:magnesium-transporting ATPase (P-type)
MFERDLDDESALKNPVLYRAGQLREYFNFKVFWKWIAYSFVHGAGTFYFCGLVRSYPFY